MKNWVLSIITTVFILSLIALILPSSKLSKHVKNTLSFIVVLVIVSPIINLKNIEVDFEKLFEYENVVIQQEYIEYLNQKKIRILTDDCQKLIQKDGVEGARIRLNYTINENSVVIIQNVAIYLDNAVINSEKEHIVIIEKLKKTLSEYLKINEDMVIVYE